jgi:dTDP-4-dehydrorhamnose reductase
MARIAITGATGFVGSNIAELLVTRGHDVVGLVRREVDVDVPWTPLFVDFNEPADIANKLSSADAVVHCAIANDFNMLMNDQEKAFDAYVGLTSRVAKAANALNAHLVYISTDWIMDGTRHMTPESAYGNPINIYGFLKAMSEQVVRDLCPDSAAICRIGGVMGAHRLYAQGPRSQDVGFGYFVSALVTALKAGETFAVWGGPFVNEIATPSLAAEIAAEVERVVALRAIGQFHLVGDDAVTRMQLAELTCEVFDLDTSLLRQIDAPADQLFPQGVPVDTSLANTATKQALKLGPTPLRELLGAFRRERETGQIQALTQPYSLS